MKSARRGEAVAGEMLSAACPNRPLFLLSERVAHAQDELADRTVARGRQTGRHRGTDATRERAVAARVVLEARERGVQVGALGEVELVADADGVGLAERDVVLVRVVLHPLSAHHVLA